MPDQIPCPTESELRSTIGYMLAAVGDGTA